MCVLVVRSAGSGSLRCDDWRREGAAGCPIRRLFRGLPRQRLRGECRDRRAAVGHPRRPARRRQDYQRAGSRSGRRAFVRAGRVVGGNPRTTAHLQVLHVPGQPGRARRQVRATDVEDVHISRAAHAAQNELDGHADLRPGGRRDLESADHRSQTPRHLRRYRQSVRCRAERDR